MYDTAFTQARFKNLLRRDIFFLSREGFRYKRRAYRIEEVTASWLRVRYPRGCRVRFEEDGAINEDAEPRSSGYQSRPLRTDRKYTTCTFSFDRDKLR